MPMFDTSKADPVALEKARRWTKIEKDWFAKFIWIQNRQTGKPSPFILNVLQEDFALRLNYQRAMGFKVQAQLLKPRKVGFSTYISARFWMHANLEENLKCLTVAHVEDSTGKLFDMIKLMKDMAPENIKGAFDKDSDNTIRFAPPHRSELQTLTAGGDEIGRGWDLHRAHFSEYHFWKKDKSFLSALNAMSEGDYFELLLESTANGVGRQSYTMWKDAEEHKSERPDDWDCWQTVFYSWLEVPWYSKQVPEGYEWGTMKDEEYELKQLGATPEQLYWRRLRLPTKCKNDPDLFKQEYPATVSEAFLCSQGSVFTKRILGPHRDMVLEAEKENPAKIGQLVWANADKTRVEFVESDHPFHWEIWQWPHYQHDYSIGGDPAGHSQSDPNDPMSSRDWSCGAVLDRSEKEFVAVYRGRFGSEDEFGEELLKAAVFYNDAWVVPEVNIGDAVLIPLKEYPNLYMREGAEEDVTERLLGKYGWKTTDGGSGDRKSMVAEWKQVCRKDDEWQRVMKVYSRVLLAEEETFIYNKKGKPEHQPGCHDDMIFAHMLANEGDRRLPRQWNNAPEIHSVGGSEPSLVMHDGAYDDWSEDTEDEYDYIHTESFL